MHHRPAHSLREPKAISQILAMVLVLLSDFMIDSKQALEFRHHVLLIERRIAIDGGEQLIVHRAVGSNKCRLVSYLADI